MHTPSTPYTHSPCTHKIPPKHPDTVLYKHTYGIYTQTQLPHNTPTRLHTQLTIHMLNSSPCTHYPPCTSKFLYTHTHTTPQHTSNFLTNPQNPHQQLYTHLHTQCPTHIYNTRTHTPTIPSKHTHTKPSLPHKHWHTNPFSDWRGPSHFGISSVSGAECATAPILYLHFAQRFSGIRGHVIPKEYTLAVVRHGCLIHPSHPVPSRRDCTAMNWGQEASEQQGSAPRDFV